MPMDCIFTKNASAVRSDLHLIEIYIFVPKGSRSVAFIQCFLTGTGSTAPLYLTQSIGKRPDEGQNNHFISIRGQNFDDKETLDKSEDRMADRTVVLYISDQVAMRVHCR